MPLRLVVIGAGPIGIAAAIGAIDRGYETTLFEQGEVGDSLRSWGETRFFTPLAMNISPRMREILGSAMPSDQALLTGPAMADQVLRPLSESSLLKGSIVTGTRVRSVGRRGLRRGDLAGHPMRAERPFRLLVETADGSRTVEADIVLDATGGYSVPNPIGTGGLPAPSESRLATEPIRTLGQLQSRREDLPGKKILLLGNGHSAANAIAVLEDLARRNPATRVTWAVRSPNLRPCQEMANDPLPERRSIVSHANDLAEAPPPFLTVERRATIESLSESGDVIEVLLTGMRTVRVDVIAAFTGFRPDGSHLSELPLELSPVTEGGARLYRATSNVTDCLTVPKVSLSDLESGEPNYYLIGSRSYGRAPTFLLQAGLQQLETILDSLPR